jgi:hypothetical protein
MAACIEVFLKVVRKRGFGTLFHCGACRGKKEIGHADGPLPAFGATCHGQTPR